MLSTSLFGSDGNIYNQSAVFGTTFQLNQTALNEIGLPALTGMCLSFVSRSFPPSWVYVTQVPMLGPT